MVMNIKPDNSGLRPDPQRNAVRCRWLSGKNKTVTVIRQRKPDDLGQKQILDVSSLPTSPTYI